MWIIFQPNGTEQSALLPFRGRERSKGAVTPEPAPLMDTTYG